MSSKKPARRLRDIVENAESIASYIEGLNPETFAQDRKTRDAVERCLQRISEAAIKLGKRAEELVPDQPWQDIRGLGNVLRHEYDDINLGQIWNTAAKDVPLLERDCRVALERLSSERNGSG